MSLHNELLLEQYKENQKAYRLIDQIVTQELQRLVKEVGFPVNSIESRIKAEKSLKGKLELKGTKYHSILDITDIVGARIVTFYNDEVDKIAAKIEKLFIIDWENSVDKRALLKYDQFGYSSLHYICKIPKEIFSDPKLPIVNEIRFEIQIKSILQHAWASMYHDTGYKNDVEVPKEYMRGFSRLAGLLELADESFIQIRTSISEYRRKVHQVVKNGKLEDVELNIDTYNEYLASNPFSELNNRIASINNMQIEEGSLRNFLKVFKSFGFTTLKQLDTFVKDYGNLAYEYAVRQFSGRDVDIITTLTGPLTLSVVYIIKQNMGEGIIKLLLDIVYGERKSNVTLAKRLMDIGYSMGLIKEENHE